MLDRAKLTHVFNTQRVKKVFCEDGTHFTWKGILPDDDKFYATDPNYFFPKNREKWEAYVESIELPVPAEPNEEEATLEQLVLDAALLKELEAKKEATEEPKEEVPPLVEPTVLEKPVTKSGKKKSKEG